jgi:hypothetical protein
VSRSFVQCIVAVLSVVPLCCQVSTASISRRRHRQYGGVVPGATVTLKQVETDQRAAGHGPPSVRAGLTLTSNFTHSKSLDITSAPANILLTGGGLIPDPTNPRLRRGRSDFDVPNTWRTSLVWAVPYARHEKGLARLLSDWEVNGLFTIESGLPFSVAAPFNNSFTGEGLDFADVVPGQSPTLSGSRSRNDKVNQWFNTAAFAANQAGTYGNAGRNIINAPGLVNFDFALVKPFPIGERFRLMFRSEFFDLLNTPEFFPPGATLATATFGKITSSRDPRILQVVIEAKLVRRIQWNPDAAIF